MANTLNRIQSTLTQYCPPGLAQDVVSANILRGVNQTADGYQIQLRFGYPIEDIQHQIVADLQTLLSQTVDGPLGFDLCWEVKAHAVQPGQKGWSSIKNVIAVASGKGGVGKSTTAVNLAFALHQAGARVGLCDADIYGPNQPHLLGTQQKPELTEQKQFRPVIVRGVQTNSMGYLVSDETPMVWRGPMVTQALMQLVTQTAWDNLDYLIIDMPPGTGDVQLTLSSKIPVAGAVMVTTPQDLALLDVRKGIEMFRKVNVNILGIIENMSTHVCEQCGHESALFGKAGGARLSEITGVPLLGQIPLALKLRETADAGTPIVCTDHPLAERYKLIARRLVANLSLTRRNYDTKLPEVVVQPL